MTMQEVANDIVLESPRQAAGDAANTEPEELPDDYYVRAFMLVIGSVSDGCHDLLLPQELDWIACIRRLPESARRLYIRLLQRKASTFRLSKLSYADIADIPQAAGELISAPLASGDAPATLAELADTYTLAELERLVPASCPAGTRRAARLSNLIKRNSVDDRRILADADSWLTVLGHEPFAVCRLCYFGNLRQDLSEFVITALGTQRYESVPLDNATRFFRDRAQLEAHLRYYECAALFDLQPRHDLGSLQTLVAMLPEPIDGDRHLDRRLERLLIEMAKSFERLGDLVAARRLYRRCHQPPARERLVRLLERDGCNDERRRLLYEIAAAPADESEKDFAQRKLSTASSTVRTFRPRTTTLVLPETKRRVERVAAEYFARDGACFWVENRLFTSLLGLWIWDIMFLPLRGAFFNPFQAAPADFRERGFQTAREDELKARFSELDADNARECFTQRVHQTLESRRGISNPLVSWETAASPVLDLAIERIPLADLRAVFERILEHPVEHASGLPDLVYFPSAGSYELIEIKGPGDSLQANQRRWLRYFDRHGISARVLKVRWTRNPQL